MYVYICMYTYYNSLALGFALFLTKKNAHDSALLPKVK